MVRVSDLAASHDQLRPLMFSIAYRMLGSVVEAEDVVQDAFLEMHRSGTDVDSLDAFATTVTTRLAIDQLRSARRRREEYVGTWLPEPVVDTSDADPAHRIEVDESLSVAFLVLLEQLSPVERAVFVLREVFDYGYADIAAVVEKSEANCRQLLARARRRIEAGRPRFRPSPQERAAVASEFLAAMRHGDLAGLERLLADDVTLYADGGGKAPSARSPVRGVTAVARFLLGLVRLAERFDMVLEPIVANGQPSARVISADGALLGVVTLDVVEGRVHAIRNQINPDKLTHLGRVGDLATLLTARGDGAQQR